MKPFSHFKALETFIFFDNIYSEGNLRDASVNGEKWIKNEKQNPENMGSIPEEK